MKKNDIIESLNKHIKDYPNKIFYKECFNEINNIYNNIYNNNEIIKNITQNKYVLESTRITILYNINKFKIYLSNKEELNSTNYLLNIDNNIKNKLIYQLSCITKYNSILALENDQVVPEIDFNKNMYVVISEDKFEELYELKNLYEISGYIFGIEIFKILEYQQLDRIIGFIKKFAGGDNNGYNTMENYLKHTRKYDWRFRDNLVVINNMVFNVLGLIEKKNIELLGILEWDSKDAMSITSEFQDNVDVIVTTNNHQLYQKNGKCIKYNYRWLTTILPAYVNADNIMDIICDPTHVFTFMGIKFMSLDFIINKILSELNSTNFLDLYMLKKIGKYDIGDKLCIPNMLVKYGHIKIFDDGIIDKIYNKIVIKAQDKYNYELSYEEIKGVIRRCNENAFDIYQGKHIYDPDTAIIKKFHRDVKAKIFFEYCKDREYLLDIGSGQLTDAMFWNKVGIKNVIGIEPSETSIENGFKRLEKYGTRTKIQIVNGIGNESWLNNKKYDIVLAHKYDIVTFQFTIHYMIHDIDMVINNFVGLCKPGALVIINCMNGNKIFEEIQNKGFIEVRDEIEPIFAIYPKYDYKSEQGGIEKDVMVYFRGAFGVQSGSEEPIVDIKKMIHTFNKYGFALLRHRDFLDYHSRVKDNMTSTQKRVSYYYTSLVFKKR